MSKVQNDILMVLPKEQYKLATDSLLSIPLEFSADRKNLIDSNRTRNVNAYDQSVNERNESNIYRIGGKITEMFNNSLIGNTNYSNFKNFLYLTNALDVVTNNDILFNNLGQRVEDIYDIKWEGSPQYHEFSFIRYDVDNPQLDYQPKSSSTYNWTTYLSYVYSASTTQKMSYVNKQLSGNTVNFIASDGIPFTIINTVVNGGNYITFRCGGKHNLTPGQYVELSFKYNDSNIFQVDAIGEEGYDNEDTSFSILNYGFTGTTFTNGVSGTFKRIGDINNIEETKSQYYVRLHKILTPDSGITINKMGFENIPFPKKEKVEYSALTPNLVERVSVLDGTQSYSFTAVKDLEVTGLVTNFNKPVTSVYLTIVNKGYTGWFNKPNNFTNSGTQYGWDFNFQSNIIDDWWSFNNLDSFENIPTTSYLKMANNITYQFYYNAPLNIGDTLVGDFCEYNAAEQLEYFVSSCNYKLTFNDTLYQIDSQSTSIPEGYFYKPHHEIILKKYSNDISIENTTEPQDRPFWAYYSKNEGYWKWRNILLPGELEDDNNGVDYPFANGAHYPFSNFLFLLTTPFKNINVTEPVTQDPTKDDCE